MKLKLDTPWTFFSLATIVVALLAFRSGYHYGYRLAPGGALQEILSDAPVYRMTFWITNRSGVMYEVVTTAIKTNAVNYP